MDGLDVTEAEFQITGIPQTNRVRATLNQYRIVISFRHNFFPFENQTLSSQS